MQRANTYSQWDELPDIDRSSVLLPSRSPSIRRATTTWPGRGLWEMGELRDAPLDRVAMEEVAPPTNVLQYAPGS